MNAESEKGISVNAPMVIRNLLGEKIIVGLRAVKGAVKFHNHRHVTRSLRDRGGSLDREEQEAMGKMQTTDELLSGGTLKLQTTLSSGSKGDSEGAKVACVTRETAKSNQAKMERKLKAVKEKQKEVNAKNHKLLEKALPTGASALPSKSCNRPFSPGEGVIAGFLTAYYEGDVWSAHCFGLGIFCIDQTKYQPR